MFSFSYFWPIGLVVLSNILYQIFAKLMPKQLNVFASLTVIYLVAAAVSFVLFAVQNKGQGIIEELQKLNIAPFVLGLAIIGLEAGFILAYKIGWPVSTAAIVQSSLLAIALIFVGWLIFREPLSWNKLVGVGICLVGLIFINCK